MYQAHFKIPLINTFMASSVYIIICMTINRFFSMWMPGFFREFHTTRNAVISVVVCFLFGSILHIPLCFQNTIVDRGVIWERLGSSNETINRTLPYYQSLEYEPVAESDLFKVYLVVSEIFLRFGPIVVLAVLNILIIFKFKEVTRRRSMLKGLSSPATARRLLTKTEAIYEKTNISQIQTCRENSKAENRLFLETANNISLLNISNEHSLVVQSSSSSRRPSISSIEHKIIIRVADRFERSRGSKSQGCHL